MPKLTKNVVKYIPETLVPEKIVGVLADMKASVQVAKMEGDSWREAFIRAYLDKTGLNVTEIQLVETWDWENATYRVWIEEMKGD